MVVHYVMFLLYVGYQREVRWGCGRSRVLLGVDVHIKPL